MHASSTRVLAKARRSSVAAAAAPSSAQESSTTASTEVSLFWLVLYFGSDLVSFSVDSSSRFVLQFRQSCNCNWFNSSNRAVTGSETVDSSSGSGLVRRDSSSGFGSVAVSGSGFGLTWLDNFLVSFWIFVSGYWLVLSLVRDNRQQFRFWTETADSSSGSGLVSRDNSSGSGSVAVSGSGSGLVSSLVSSEHEHIESASIYTGTYYPSTLGSGPSAGTQGSATQDPHIAASDSSSEFDVMEGYPMQQHLESSSQDMHALGQQPGISMFSRLKETLSRATRSKHATNEINEGGGEVDSPFTSQIYPVLFESVHVSTPATIPIGFSKLTPSKTLLPDGRSLAKLQEVERYILAAREKEIESLRKAEQRRTTLAKAPMTSANPLQSPKLTTLKSQPIGSHIASNSKDTPNAAILDGVFLNENWKYNLQTKKLIDLYTSYTYHVGWLNIIQATSNSTSVDKQQRMICDVIHSIVQMERQNHRSIYCRKYA
ncbi:hypothetical protein L7F22_016765 [Adiantum nelumboides]|nr:hypothetical protein [Adiantum nelumboides]